MAYVDGLVAAAVDYSKIIRNLPSPGAFTAFNYSGPVALHEEWGGTTPDTTNLWTATLGGTGAITVPAADASVPTYRSAKLNCPASGDTVALSAASRLVSFPRNTKLMKKIFMEWDAFFTGTFANVQQTTTFMGLTTGGGSRTSNNVTGFYLSSDVLAGVTDRAGVESTVALTSPNAINDGSVVTLKLVIDSAGGPTVYFYTNGVLRGQLADDATQPSSTVCPSFYMESTGGAAVLRIGSVRCWWEE